MDGGEHLATPCGSGRRGRPDRRRLLARRARPPRALAGLKHLDGHVHARRGNGL